MFPSPAHLLSSTSSSALLLPHSPLHPHSRFLKPSTKPYSPSPQFPTPLPPQFAVSALPDDGPVELPFSFPSFISTDDDPSTLQVATSLLLTGAISVFLFRSLRRRAKRAKELVPFLPSCNQLSLVSLIMICV